jgi:hypothetical protein
MRRYLKISTLLFLAAGSMTTTAGAEDCPAPAAWFKNSGTPPPPMTEPKRGVDCEFYQRAWQTFLFSTDQVKGTPRFLTVNYKTYAQVFGEDKPAGLLRGPGDMLILAPRTIESALTTEAEDVVQAGSNSILIDQSGRPIFYNIIMNPNFVSFVKTNKYTDVQKLKSAPASQELPVGAVEYKAAWQIIDSVLVSDHRITSQALVPWLISDGNGKLKVDTNRPLHQVTVAMIGLHVVFRPEGHPEMVWATFEYHRNAPSIKGNPLAINKNCPNTGEPSDETVVDDGKPYLLYANGIAFKDANKRPQALSVVDDVKQIFAPRNNIVRAFPFSACFPGLNLSHAVTEIDPAIVSLNQHVLDNLKADDRRVYSLVGAVWLDEPHNPNSDLAFKEGQGFDDFQLGGEDRLSSTSMESMTQIGSPNCFSCHDTNDKGNLSAKRINVSHIFRRFSLQK